MDPHTLAIAALAWSRCLGMMFAAPGWGVPGIGARVKLVLSALVAFAIWPAAERGAIAAAGIPLPLLMVAELATGAVFGLIGSLVVAAIRQGGELVALQAGLAPASVVAIEAQWDSDAGATPFGHLFGMLALIVFLGWNGPMVLIDALAQSYDRIPTWLHGSRATERSVAWFLGLVNGAIVLAFQAAAPMGLALLVAGLVLALLARGQGRSLSGMAWPVRWLLAVLLFLACLPGLVATIEAGWRSCGGELSKLSR